MILIQILLRCGLCGQFLFSRDEVMSSYLHLFDCDDNTANRNRTWLTVSFPLGSVSSDSKPLGHNTHKNTHRFTPHANTHASSSNNLYWPPSETEENSANGQKYQGTFWASKQGKLSAAQSSWSAAGQRHKHAAEARYQAETNVERNPPGSFNHRTQRYCTREVGER